MKNALLLIDHTVKRLMYFSPMPQWHH